MSSVDSHLVPLLEPSSRADAEPEPEPKYESRKLAWLKLSASIVAAVGLMIGGIVLSRLKNKVAGSATVHSIIPLGNLITFHMGPVFTLAATIITEIIGSVHATALRSTLINERRLSPNAKYRLGFNTNSRLFVASNEGGWTNPNGQLMNALMALLLVISYAASALIVTPIQIFEGPDYNTIENRKATSGLAAPPIIIFGLSLFLQGIISLFGTYHCGPYWLDSTDLVFTTKQQIDNHTIVPRPHRCMRNVLQGKSTTYPLTTPDPHSIPDSLKPLARQPSAWNANPTAKKAAITLWSLIPVYAVWGAIVYALSVYVSTGVSKSGHIKSVGIGSAKPSDFSWAFVPNINTLSFGVAFMTTHPLEEASLPSMAWPSILLVFMAIQSGLTLTLHYCEVIINTTRDECVWRRAVGDKGVSTVQQGLLRGIIVKALGSWRGVFLLVTKYFCHWLFAQSFQITGVFAQPAEVLAESHFTGMEVIAHCAQVWYLSALLIGFATITTLIAIYKPRGPQPAAYGHFQTLADLIDEWPPVKSALDDKSPSVLYWGHKSGLDKDGICHAGTSDRRLPPVKMDYMYGGELDPKWPSTAKKESV
ncbi:hypothetical protein FIBSPDRAFT_856266 [Athelia psychrophila]|uniref:Uncharacterized protein n=1 Tax=Athelia psychrophila TaxID=1759441 RepID=A0A166NE32_9AGAM|nr:hypothetical protein FIBSPDRAFT_856266 [Fibularhizoctonia sp. CBS 109695]